MLVMLKYAVRRILLIVPTMLLVSFLVFLLVNITPANPGRLKLGATARQEDVDAINHELGYDKPLLVRYVNWVWDALHGDFGKSWYTNRRVSDELGARIGNTLKLTVLGLVTAFLLGVPLGVWCAVKRNSIPDYTFSVAAMAVAAMPVFWLSLLLLLQFSLKWKIFPSSGIQNGWISWVLPILPLTIGYGAGYIRYTRTAMLDNIYQDYVRTARAKGCSEGAVIWRHAFRNSLMTVTTITGLSFAGLMGGAYIIESIFSIPGLGVMGVNAITRKDLPYILASLITIGGLFMIIMVVIDICYAALDPRIRSWYGGEAILRRAKKYQEKHKLSEEQLAALPDPVIPEELSAKYYELKEKGGAA